MDDDDVDVITMPARKLAALNVLIMTLDSFTGWIDDINQLLCQHANWKTQRQMVADQMRFEIESIVGGE